MTYNDNRSQNGSGKILVGAKMGAARRDKTRPKESVVEFFVRRCPDGRQTATSLMEAL